MTLPRSVRRWPALTLLSVALTAANGPCALHAGAQSPTRADTVAPRSSGTLPRDTTQVGGMGSRLSLPTPPSARASTTEQRNFMRQSARSAWNFVSRSMSPGAGFVGATDTYPYMTVWDMASTIASIHSARQLGLINAGQYHRAMERAFRTIEKMPLYDRAAYNKLYASNTGAMVDRKTATSGKGYGWSVLDHGRLLIWLRIIGANDTTYATRAQAMVARLDMSRLVRDGYLQGEDLHPADSSVRRYQEGRIGYEQYAAEGFALWGARAERALDFGANGKSTMVLGHPVLADTRGDDLLTSEPFVMMGLELGWTSPTWRSLSLSVLAAQEARYKQTGIVTMVSEDAIPDPPAYFYYYLLYHNGKPFVVTAPSGEIAPTYPRWVSAKERRSAITRLCRASTRGSRCRP